MARTRYQAGGHPLPLATIGRPWDGAAIDTIATRFETRVGDPVVAGSPD